MCDRCGLLAAENAQLKDELAEWRRQGRENASIVVQGEVRIRWAKALNLPPLLVQGAILLAEREDRLVRADTIASACCLDFEQLTDPGSSAKVCVHKLRRAMTAAGIAGRIETVWGEGYRMSAATAAELRQHVDHEVRHAA
jgi:DNA-binding response OmpR family regulator